MSGGGRGRSRSDRRLTDREFADLLAFRDRLRRFNRWSDEQARSVGLTPAQHQLLLAIRGHGPLTGDALPPTIRDLSDHLLLRHHSVVELIDRTEASGYVRRSRDGRDGRVVRVVLTPAGARRVERLAELHLAELSQLAPLLDQLVADGQAFWMEAGDAASPLSAERSPR